MRHSLPRSKTLPVDQASIAIHSATFSYTTAHAAGSEVPGARAAAGTHGEATTPGDHHRKNRRKAGAVRAPNQNIENNPMQSSRARRLDGCFTPENILTRRANQRHYPTIAQFEIAHGAAHRLSARLQPKNPHN
jgi:hypothetical protein